MGKDSPAIRTGSPGERENTRSQETNQRVMPRPSTQEPQKRGDGVRSLRLPEQRGPKLRGPPTKVLRRDRRSGGTARVRRDRRHKPGLRANRPVKAGQPSGHVTRGEEPPAINQSRPGRKSTEHPPETPTRHSQRPRLPNNQCANRDRPQAPATNRCRQRGQNPTKGSRRWED